MSDTRLQSFAQGYEDIQLYRALKDVEAGFYIDVGAYDPVEDSVTKLFYDRGWSGINLEPNPKFHARLIDQRPRDLTLDLAVMDGADSVEFSIFQDTGLSTADAGVASVHRDSGLAAEVITVAAKPLRQIWADHVPAGQDVHFLKIDVEGAEASVIDSADWTNHRPWVLVVEATEPRSETESHADWEPTLLSVGYHLVHFDGLNRFYIDQARPELAKAFERPLHPAFDAFDTYREWLMRKELEHLAGMKARDGKAANALRRQIRTLENRNAEMQTHAATLTQSLNRRPKLLWERLAFRKSGVLRPVFERVFFHNSGKPRGEFRKWILRDDGGPTVPFLRHMMHPSYRQRRAAVPIPTAYLHPNDVEGRPAASATALKPMSDLSDQALEMKDRLLAAAEKVER